MQKTFGSDSNETTEFLVLTRLTSKSPSLRSKLLELFAVDLRTLGLVRIVIGSILLIDLIQRLPEVGVFYSDDGLVPRTAVFDSLPQGWPSSLHFLSGRAEVELLMFALSAVFAVMLIAGCKTRLASFCSWLLLTSLHARDPFIIHGGDSLLRMLLFWGMFTPWGARFSIDSALNRFPQDLPKSVFSIGGIALLLQMPIVYVFTGVLKNGKEWRHDFTAIEYVLKSPDFPLPLGSLLTAVPSFLKVVTIATLLVELVGPLLLFLPFFTKTARRVAIAAFVALQLGLMLTMKLGLFPIISTAALLSFVPTSFWDGLATRFGNAKRQNVFEVIGERLHRLVEGNRSTFAGLWKSLGVDPVRVKQPAALTLFCLVCLSYVVVDNLGSIARSPIRIPSQLVFVGQFLRIHQHWALFAPSPLTSCVWYVAEGRISDGRSVTVFDGRPDGPTNPDNRKFLLKTYNWRTYWRSLTLNEGRHLRPYMARYFCENWNRSHGETEAITHITIHQLEKPTRLEGPEEESRESTLLEYDCSTPPR